MEPIMTLFQRNDGNGLVRNQVAPGAEWVLAGEGIPTMQLDGMCCLIRHGRLYKRYKLPRGTPPPPDFIAAQAPDAVTGVTTGWMPVGEGPDDQWHRAAWAAVSPGRRAALEGQTLELCGPTIHGNPEGMLSHRLVRHDASVLPDAPRDFAGLAAYIALQEIEGIVWHHPDGRKVKLQARDFGLTRPATFDRGGVSPCP